MYYKSYLDLFMAVVVVVVVLFVLHFLVDPPFLVVDVFIYLFVILF